MYEVLADSADFRPGAHFGNVLGALANAVTVPCIMPKRLHLTATAPSHPASINTTPGRRHTKSHARFHPRPPAPLIPCTRTLLDTKQACPHSAKTINNNFANTTHRCVPENITPMAHHLPHSGSAVSPCGTHLPRRQPCSPTLGRHSFRRVAACAQSGCMDFIPVALPAQEAGLP